MSQDLLDLVIRGGTVVTAGATREGCDVGIAGGRVVALGTVGRGREEIDARGLLVMPGGVDTHCHLAQKSSTGLFTADGFLSGSRSAAAGGTTTIVPFAAQHRGDSLRSVVSAYHEQARESILDYAFHMIVADPTERVLGEELPGLVREGHVTFKVFMTYDALRLSDRQVLDVLAVARREGALTMFHAENHDGIAWLTQQLVAEGKTQPRWHPYARPEPVEREATARAIMLAQLVDVPILIVHVSGREALAEVRHARTRGSRVFAETCPQYLSFTRDDLDRPGFEGAKLMFSPPARDAESQAALWAGLRDGAIDLLCSDHAPYRYNDPAGKMAHGDSAPFPKIPNGIPGLAMRMPLLYSEGVRTGRLSLQRFVELTATAPARIHGLYPRKGTIAEGSDADLVLWDPAREVTVTLAMMHDQMDYNPWEGHRITGWPQVTISRGEVVMREGAITAPAGRGRFLPRSPFQFQPARGP